MSTDAQARLLVFGIAKRLLEDEAKETDLTQVGGPKLGEHLRRPLSNAERRLAQEH